MQLVCSTATVSAVIPEAFFSHSTVEHRHHHARIPKAGPVVTSFNGYIISRSVRLGRGQVAHVAHKEKQSSSSHISWSPNTMWSFYLLAFALCSALQTSVVVCSFSVQEPIRKDDIDFKCRRPVNRANKNFILTPNKTRYSNQEHVIITCASSLAKKTHKCQNTVWDPPFDWGGECQPLNTTCPPLKPIQNGFFTPSNSTFSFASKVNFTCHKGYQLVGAQFLLCDAGLKWSFKPPSCNPLVTEVVVSRSHSYILISLIFASILSIIIISELAFAGYKWRKRNKMQTMWRNYFINYTYRASQRKITRRSLADQQGAVHFTQEGAQITDL